MTREAALARHQIKNFEKIQKHSQRGVLHAQNTQLRIPKDLSLSVTK